MYVLFQLRVSATDVAAIKKRLAKLEVAHHTEVQALAKKIDWTLNAGVMDPIKFRETLGKEREALVLRGRLLTTPNVLRAIIKSGTEAVDALSDAALLKTIETDGVALGRRRHS